MAAAMNMEQGPLGPAFPIASCEMVKRTGGTSKRRVVGPSTGYFVGPEKKTHSGVFNQQLSFALTPFPES